MATVEAHSKFSASAGDRWGNCAGSMVLSRGAPRSSSKYSRWGTAGHEVASMALIDGTPVKGYKGRRIAVEHETIEVDDRMVKVLEPYVELVETLRDTLGATLLVEQRLDYGIYLGGRSDAWGTGDAVLLAGDEIIVIDLKTGSGEQVDAESNTQLQLYALGALAKFGDYGDFTTVRVIISQPAIRDTPSEWVTTVTDLLEFGRTMAAAADKVDRAESCAAPDDPVWQAGFLNPGDKQCRWCPAKGTCPELRAEVARTVWNVAPATADEFANLDAPTASALIKSSDDEWLAAAMAKTDLVETWIAGVRGEVEARLLAGGEVKGYKVVRGKQGNRAWTSENDVEKMLREQFRLPVEKAYDFKLISPTTAEKLLAKESPVRWKKLLPLISRSEGKLSVAHVTDKREAVDVTPVVDDFADVSAEPAGDASAGASEYA